MSKTLKRFKLKSLTKGKEPWINIGIIGPHKTGKTAIIKNIIYYFKPRTRYTFLISGSSGADNEYSGFVPELYTYDSFDPKVVQRLFDDQALVRDKLSRRDPNRKIKDTVILIMDDIVGTDSKWKTATQIQKLVAQGRHFNMVLIVSVQDPMSIPSSFRNNLDYVIQTCITSEKKVERFYTNYFDDRYGKLDEYKKMADKIFSVQYQFMILDKNAVGKGDPLEKYIYYGMACAPERIPKPYPGLKKVWDINNKYYDPRYLVKGNQSDKKEATEFKLA